VSLSRNHTSGVRANTPISRVESIGFTVGSKRQDNPSGLLGPNTEAETGVTQQYHDSTPQQHCSPHRCCGYNLQKRENQNARFFYYQAGSALSA